MFQVMKHNYLGLQHVINTNVSESQHALDVGSTGTATLNLQAINYNMYFF